MKRIVSVSRRTDIPAFYGKWFINRLRQGWGVNYNPYSHKVSEVSLYPESVAAFVFWSKNFKPFLRYLDEIDTAPTLRANIDISNISRDQSVAGGQGQLFFD